MRAQEFIKESFGPEQHPGVLPIGDYLSPDSEFEDPTGKRDPVELHQEVDDILNAGGEPRVVRIKPSQVYATQDWLSNSGGDGPLYPEYEDLPVVYQKGRYPSYAWYVLDGHHRITAALKKHQPIDVYMFGDYQLDQLKENFHDGKVKGKSRPGRVKRAGASCDGSVSSLRAKAKKYGGERGKMYHWCANMKGGKKK